jgi:hypothetical protein
MFRTSKVKRRQNSYGGYPTEFAGLTQNPKKMIGTPPIRIKFSQNNDSFQRSLFVLILFLPTSVPCYRGREISEISHKLK